MTRPRQYDEIHIDVETAKQETVITVSGRLPPIEAGDLVVIRKPGQHDGEELLAGVALFFLGAGLLLGWLFWGRS